MAVRWFAIATVLLLAGCADDVDQGGRSGVPGDACGPHPDRERLQQDWSKETWNASLQASGVFAIALPVPISPGGTQVLHWTANVSAPVDWSVTAVTTARGDALLVQGSGPGVVSSCSIQPQAARGNGCCAEQFLDAHWSTGGDRSSEKVAVEVRSGTVDVAIAYEAGSNWCGADASFAAPGQLARGWHDVPGSHGAYCQ